MIIKTTNGHSETRTGPDTEDFPRMRAGEDVEVRTHSHGIHHGAISDKQLFGGLLQIEGYEEDGRRWTLTFMAEETSEIVIKKGVEKL